MLIVNRLGEDAGRYYLPGPVTGRWCGTGRHQLGLDGAIGPGELDAVLRGRDPHSGELLSDRRVPHRRAGTDLIFTAPKSLSLLAALAPDGDVVARAHLRACADAFSWLEANGCWARRRGGLVATSGFVAGRFSHRFSAAGEPHLHTHVLVANMVRAGDDRWSALDGGGIWLHRRAVAAAYHLGLRQQLLAAGLRPRWDLRPDGTAEIVGVPATAMAATSSRRRQILDQRRAGEDLAPRMLTAAQRTTREQAQESSTWAQRSDAAGFGSREADVVVVDARRRADLTVPDPTAPDDRLSDDVVVWLDRRRSTFGVPDVLQALAATHVEGASAVDAHRWARAFVDASPTAPDGRHTSTLSAQHDGSLASAALARSGGGVSIDGADADPARPRTPAAERLLTSGNGVDVLGRPSSDTEAWAVTRRWGGFIAQAAAVDEARRGWEQAGHAVAVDAPSSAAADRWRALAGLERHLPGTDQPAVLVVDRADRRPTAELRRILDGAGAAGSKVVLVEGGTLPARRVALSQGLEQMAVGLGRVVPELDGSTLGPVAAQERSSLPLPFPGPDGLGGQGSQAMGLVVGAWADRRGRGSPARMVALGPAECDELNRRARAELRGDGSLRGPEVSIAGRPYAVGDEVVTTRRGSLPAGTMGTVGHVDPSGALTVETDGGPLQVDSRVGRFVRHAYAVTPGMLRFDDRPVVLLGEPAALGRHADRVIGAHAVEPDVGLAPRRRGREHLDATIGDPGRKDPARLPPPPADPPAREEPARSHPARIDGARPGPGDEAAGRPRRPRDLGLGL